MSESTEKKSKKKSAKNDLRRQRKIERLNKKLRLSAPVPEGLKKAWERENRVTLLRKRRQQAIAKQLPDKRARQAKRIEEYEAKYKQIKHDRQSSIKQARLEGNIFKPADPKIAIVVRIRGINRVSPKVRKVLQLFRLLQLHNAVFVKINKATVNMLKLIQPYIAYGYPTVSTIRSLIYKRGFAKIRHRPGAISRIPIMRNELIEKHLGKFGMETVEDVVYQLYTVGPKFKYANNFLWPFKLNNPKGGYRGRKRRHFNEGGSYGNWENHINNFIMRML